MKASALVEIGEKAVERHRLDVAKKQAKAALIEAYIQWKDGVSVDHVERHSKDWEEMMVDTKPQFDAFKRASSAAYNAKSRLERAIVRGPRFDYL